MDKNIRAFSLVEAAIVVVIIGLILSFVKIGTELISQAKLRHIINEINLYDSAFNSFVHKYSKVPGDMTNAFFIWGAAEGCSDNNILTTNGGCNGNGDGKIDISKTCYTCFPAEGFKAVQFLAAAGYIKGSYNGNNRSTIVPGDNVPMSKYADDVGIIFAATNATSLYRYSGSGGTHLPSYSIDASGKNFLVIARPTLYGGSGRNELMHGGFLSPVDMKSIDKKIDDALPKSGALAAVSGKPRTAGSGSDWCYQANSTNEYLLTHDTQSCHPIYFMDK